MFIAKKQFGGFHNREVVLPFLFRSVTNGEPVKDI